MVTINNANSLNPPAQSGGAVLTDPPTQGKDPAMLQAIGELLSKSSIPGLPGMDFTFLSPDALMSLVELQLQKVDGEIFGHMKDVDARREAGQLLGVAGSALKEAKLGLEQNANYFASNITVTGQSASNTLVVKTFPNTPAGQKDAQEVLQKLGGPKWIQTPAKPQELAQLEQKLLQASEKAAAAGYSDVAAQLKQMAGDLKAGKPIEKGALEKAASDIETTMQGLSSGSEMIMIKLQDLMQQRSRVIMFVTNALASINETARKIVDNIR